MNQLTGYFSLNFFLLLVICLLPSLPAAAESEPIPAVTSDYILFLNPDAETCAWSETLIPPIAKELRNRFPELAVEVQYMYGLGINSEEDMQGFKDRLFAKYAKRPTYLLLFETDIYGILHEEIEQYWGDVPILIVGREDYIGPEKYYLERKYIPETERVYIEKLIETRPNLRMVYNPFDLENSLRLMVNFFGDLEKILFVTDARYISDRLRVEVEQIVDRQYPNMELQHMTPDKLTTDQLIEIFRAMPDKQGVLYFTWFNNEMTADKDLYLQTNAYRIFSLYVNSPVFTINDVGLKESGMLGGSYTRYDQVLETFNKAFDDMVAKKQNNRFVTCPKPVPTFNYLTMLNHNIPTSLLPKNSYLYHRPLTFLEKNRDLILGLAIIIFLAIVFTRIILLLKTRKMQNKEIKLLEKYGDLFNNMPIAYRQEQLLLDNDGEPIDVVVTEVNPGFESQLSTRHNVIGKRGSEVHPDMYPELLNIYKTLLHDKKQKISLSYYHNETDRYFSVIISSSSTPGYMDLFFVDTTELLKTQQMLRTVNNKLIMSLDIANITPWKWDIQKGKLLCDINDSMEPIAEGITDDNQLIIAEEKFFALIHEEDVDRVKASLKDLEEGRVAKAKEEYRIKTGVKDMYEWIEVQAAVEKRDEQGHTLSLIGSSLIITERKQIEEELRRAKEKAEESNRLKSAFLANMSHEIRTPLNAIVGFSNILAATEEMEDKQEYINIIETNNTLLLQLVSDILDLSKFEAGTMEFRYSDVELNSLMQEQLSETMEKAAEGVKVTFEQRLPELQINVEKNRLMQVLSNLLANAVKFTTQGSIRFGYEVMPNNILRFYVTDTGRGISQEQLDKIFGRFVKLDLFVQGTGLGLSVCQAIVQHFGGEIGVDSKEGEGSTFWFTFPYTAPSKEVTIEVMEDTHKEKLKVLIAEDNLSNFELFEFILKRDFDIIHAWDGKEAIELFKKTNPHIILMDINMPKMNGYEATMEIRRLSKEVPIIAVTAYAFSTDEQQIRKNGFDAFSPKPLNALNLKRQMADLLKGQVTLL